MRGDRCRGGSVSVTEDLAAAAVWQSDLNPEAEPTTAIEVETTLNNLRGLQLRQNCPW